MPAEEDGGGGCGKSRRAWRWGIGWLWELGLGVGVEKVWVVLGRVGRVSLVRRAGIMTVDGWGMFDGLFLFWSFGWRLRDGVKGCKMFGYSQLADGLKLER